MNRKLIVQIAGGLLGFGIIQIVVYFFLFIVSFEFMACGNDLLNDRKVDSILFFTLTGLALTQTIICIRLILKIKYSPIGIVGLFPNVVTFYFIYLVGPNCLEYDNYYREFSKQEWKENSRKPIKMVRYIVNYNFLEGKTKEEVIKLLGENEHWISKEDELSYSTEDSYSPLVVEFKNGKVSRCYLDCLE